MLGTVNARRMRMQTNAPTTVSATVHGTTITANASANTKGAFSAGELIASTNFDVYMMALSFTDLGASGATRRTLTDIGIGASGSETVIIPNILSSNNIDCSTNQQGPAQILLYPIYIRAGTRIAARCQASTGGDTVEVGVVLYGGPDSPPWPVYRRSEAFGADTTNTNGVAIAAAVTPGTEGNWSPVGSTTGQQLYGLSAEVMMSTSTSQTAHVGHMEAGIGSVQILGAEWVMMVTGTENCVMFPGLPIPCNIPSGVQLQARLESSSSSSVEMVVLRGWL